jgi:hypothetical protein
LSPRTATTASGGLVGDDVAEGAGVAEIVALGAGLGVALAGEVARATGCAVGGRALGVGAWHAASHEPARAEAALTSKRAVRSVTGCQY